MLKICFVCGSSFSGRRRANHPTREKYCSVGCKGVELRKRRIGFCKKGLEAIKHPTTWDIAWAAGIFEGEGHTRRQSNSEHVAVAQKDSWLPNRLKDLFGGSVLCSGKKPINYWTISGSRARGFLMTIYGFLSPVRQAQVRKSLGVSSE